MNSFQPPREKPPPIVAASKGIALTGSWLMVFIATPVLHRATDPIIRSFAETQYGRDWIDLASFGGLIICACVVFFATSLIANAILVPAAMKFSRKIY